MNGLIRRTFFVYPLPGNSIKKVVVKNIAVVKPLLEIDKNIMLTFHRNSHICFGNSQKFWAHFFMISNEGTIKWHECLVTSGP